MIRPALSLEPPPPPSPLLTQLVHVDQPLAQPRRRCQERLPPRLFRLPPVAVLHPRVDGHVAQTGVEVGVGPADHEASAAAELAHAAPDGRGVAGRPVVDDAVVDWGDGREVEGGGGGEEAVFLTVLAEFVEETSRAEPADQEDNDTGDH